MIASLKPAIFPALMAVLVALSGCGFQPMYATPGFDALPGARIVAGDDRQDYLIEQALDRFLGPGRNARTLTLQVGSDEDRLGLSAAGRASRFAYHVRVRYTLSEPDGGTVSGDVRETIFFDAPGDPYALIAARADAEERAADQIAEALARDLAAQLQRRRPS